MAPQEDTNFLPHQYDQPLEYAVRVAHLRVPSPARKQVKVDAPTKRRLAWNDNGINRATLRGMDESDILDYHLRRCRRQGHRPKGFYHGIQEMLENNEYRRRVISKCESEVRRLMELAGFREGDGDNIYSAGGSYGDSIYSAGGSTPTESISKDSHRTDLKSVWRRATEECGEYFDEFQTQSFPQDTAWGEDVKKVQEQESLLSRAEAETVIRNTVQEELTKAEAECMIENAKTDIEDLERIRKDVIRSSILQLATFVLKVREEGGKLIQEFPYPVFQFESDEVVLTKDVAFFFNENLDTINESVAAVKRSKEILKQKESVRRIVSSVASKLKDKERRDWMSAGQLRSCS